MNVRLEPAVVGGFRFAGVAAGLRAERGRPDLGIIVTDSPVAAAAVFTTNRVKAAPVQVAREHIGGGRLQAVTVNSGSANCFTGKAGLKLARDSATCLARAIGCDPKLVAPCSTGVIGHLYDLEKYRAGITAAVAALDAASLADFANAILTTDTRAKIVSLQTTIEGAPITVAACAKGAGMIQPKMATMLAFIVTDAAAPSVQLRALLKRILPVSFNAVTVDGDMSTNDTLILLASGAAGNRRLSGRGLAKFEQAIGAVAETVARELVRDGEGATKLVRIDVRGARTAVEADRVAREIANSPLVKTAFFGCDPNFGRIAMAAGKAGVAIDSERLEVSVGGIRIASGGALNVAALPAAGEKMKQPEFDLVLNLKQGKASARVFTCDLSFNYVKINAEYTT
jgi:glutamate N-acetyltransferase/amino-acid N-acetyltransferase